MVAAALRFNVSNPAITAALVGCTTKQHVDEAVAAVEGFTPHDAAKIERIREELLDSFDGLCTGCGYCLPCPHGGPVPQFMDAYNENILADGDKSLLDRLKYHWNLPVGEAAGCDRCGACEVTCTQQLPIIERLEHIAGLTGDKPGGRCAS